MTTAEKSKLLQTFEEHCTHCPDDLFAVITALITVEEQLDYEMQYQLKYLVGAYAKAWAEMHPNGYQAVLDNLPLSVSESLVDTTVKLYHLIETMGEYAGKVLPHMETLIDNVKEKLGGMPQEPDLTALDGLKQNILKKSVYAESKDLEEFRLSSTISEARSEDGSIYLVRLIKEGMTSDGLRYYNADVLKASMNLFENAQSFMDHPDKTYQGGDRPVKELVGWYDKVSYKEKDGLYADWHVLANSGIPYLRGMLNELQQNDKLDLIGLSLLGAGKAKLQKVKGKIVKYAESIDYVKSVDVVDVPGAGGRIVELLKLSQNRMEDGMTTETFTTLEEMKEKNPELYEKLLGEAKHMAPDPTDKEKKKMGKEKNKEKVKESDDESPEDILEESDGSKPKLDPIRETVDDLMKELKVERLRGLLDRKLEASKLPTAMREAVQKQFEGEVFKESELDTQIKLYKDTFAEAVPFDSEILSRIPNHLQIINGEDRLQAAMDRLCGLDVEDKFKNDPRFRGINEAYVSITGDYEMTFGAQPIGDWYREALPTAGKIVGGGTITFANILGTSINRRLMKQYMKQVLWWEPVVNITDIQNLKQQDRNMVESLGSLTERTTAGAEYVELTAAERLETWSPTEYGNVVTIAQRAIVNDDLNGLIRNVDEMGRSAAITLNEYVSNLFTQSSGTGPALTDTFAVFDNANHQGNTDTNILNRANLKVAVDVIAKMTDVSSKRIGLMGKWLLGPPDLREIMYQLTVSPLVPDSANNARNLYADLDLQYIVVPNWIDVNNWYFMADPSQIESIEMGFLYGRRDPEFFSQTDPSTGMVFTHDAIAYKIRHRYGGDWLEYRGAYAGLPA